MWDAWTRFHQDERGFILPLLGTIAGAVTAAAPIYAGLQTLGIIKPTSAAAPVTTAQLPAPIGAPAARGLVAAARWIVTIAKKYGVVIANAVYDLYQEYKIQGLQDGEAKRRAKEAHGVKTGRRMNPTNVRALRRAVRRVRSFQRVSRKVHRLFPRRSAARVYHVPSGYRHRARRGDLNLFATEDLADVVDEAEDLGYDPAFFPTEDEVPA